MSNSNEKALAVAACAPGRQAESNNQAYNKILTMPGMTPGESHEITAISCQQ
jgi:hypothetical protein